MKIISKSLLIVLLGAASLTACQNEDNLREDINPDSLRTFSVEKIKDLSPGKINYKLSLPGVVMSSSDNFDSDAIVIQAGNESKDGILIKTGTSASFTFGDKVELNMDGVELSEDNGLYTITVPDPSYLTKTGSGAAYEAPVINLSQLRSGNFQSMYVAMEGFQAVEENLEGTMSGAVKYFNEALDTVTVFTAASSALANAKVPEGSGTVKGIVVRSEGEWVIRPQSTSDIALDQDRFSLLDPDHGVIIWTEGSSLNSIVAKVSTNPIDGAQAIDTEGPANCFIISEKGAYSFAATDASGAYPDGIPAGTTIYVDIASATGNAVIGYIDLDSKAILWTWHIWATGIPASQMEISNGGITMLKRLLGAMNEAPSSPATRGLYYQWGRKDPFVGVNTIGVGDDKEDMKLESEIGGDATASTIVNTDLVPLWNYAEGSAATSTPQGGAAVPTTFISSSDFSIVPSAGDETWNPVANPCPPGYTVPNVEQAEAFFSGLSGEMDVTDNLGIEVLGTWFPNNGDRARKNGRILSLGRAYYSWLDTPGVNMNITRKAFNASGSFNRGNGTGVRCVKAGSEPLPPEHATYVWAEGESLTSSVSKVSTNPINGATELSGPANCYVAPSAGSYYFEAKDAAGQWPEGIPEGTKIYFTASSGTGNTVVGYLNDEGKLLWTWHIWQPGAQLSEMETTAGGVTMLGRLLGATSVTPGDPAACGLYYQWGRKDPFIGASIKGDYAADKEKQSEAALGGEATAKSTVNTELVSDWNVAELSEATSHQGAASLPTTFFSNSSFDLVPSAGDATWNPAANPCPAGYKVPDADAAKAFFADTTVEMDITENLGTTIRGIWYPNNGDRARKDGRLLSLGRRHFSWLESLSGNSGEYMVVSSSGASTGKFNRGNATGVRCVKQ